VDGLALAQSVFDGGIYVSRDRRWIASIDATADRRPANPCSSDASSGKPTPANEIQELNGLDVQKATTGGGGLAQRQQRLDHCAFQNLRAAIQTSGPWWSSIR
jgi:hypothetical protein